MLQPTGLFTEPPQWCTCTVFDLWEVTGGQPIRTQWPSQRSGFTGKTEAEVEAEREAETGGKRG